MSLRKPGYKKKGRGGLYLLIFVNPFTGEAVAFKYPINVPVIERTPIFSEDSLDSIMNQPSDDPQTITPPSPHPTFVNGFDTITAENFVCKDPLFDPFDELDHPFGNNDPGSY